MRNRILLILMLILASSGIAQDTTQTKGPKAALLFNFNRLELQPFAGGVGYKYWTANKLALHTSLDLGYSIENINSTSERTNTKLGLSTGIQFHPKNRDKISPYWEGALGLIYTKSKRSNSTKFSSLTSKFHLAMGAEYWLTKRLSLAAQYAFEVKASTNSNNYIHNGKLVDSKSTSVHFCLGETRLTLAVYL